MEGIAKRKIKMTSREGYSKGTGLWIWGVGLFPNGKRVKKGFHGARPGNVHVWPPEGFTTTGVVPGCVGGLS